MSESDNNPQSVQQPQEPKPVNKFGIAGFVVAIVGLVLSIVLSFIPVVHLIHGISYIPWFVGLVFSLIGVFRHPKRLAVIGIIISSVYVVVSIFLPIVSLVRFFI